MTLKQQSVFIKLAENQTLHMRRICKTDATRACGVFLCMRAAENGKIFTLTALKVLAPFLAEQGYVCYVADLRGRGESKPAISKYASYGQTEAILEDIPAFLAKIEQLCSVHPHRYWAAHSWGGVLMNSVFARFPNLINDVRACAYFGSKRTLYNHHPSKYIQGNLIWYGLAPLLARKHGLRLLKN